MIAPKKRSNDEEGDRSYKRRSLIDFKTAMLIVAALFGGGATDLGVSIVKEKIAEENKIRIEKNETRMEGYIISHDREETLRDLNLSNILETIKDDIKEIKQDVKKIKNGN